MTCTTPQGPSTSLPEPTFLFESFYLGCLAQASYLVGGDGEVAIVDPRRDVDVYLDAARRLGVRIRYVIETHLHADFVSGHVELAERTGATILISHRAGVAFAHQGVQDGDLFRVGPVELRILETPGHTPESISILASDTRAANSPQVVMTGDTLFIGDVGRPDLLGARGITAEHMAGLMYDSLHQKLLTLPDDVLVYPGHGAGSLCGKNLSKDPFSTIGRQKQTNVALQPMTRDEFIAFLTKDAPEIPRYFPMDVEMNRRGAPSLASDAPAGLTPQAAKAALDQGAVAIDVRPSSEWTKASVSRSLNIGLGGQFASWAGTLLDARRPLVIVATDLAAATEARLRLARVGLENVVGYLEGGLEAWQHAGYPVDRTEQVTVRELEARLRESAAAHPFQVVDVRRPGEWATGHIESAVHAPLHQLEDRAEALDPSLPTYVICAGGYRSVMGAEILRELGIAKVIDVAGGMAEWKAQGLPVSA